MKKIVLDIYGADAGAVTIVNGAAQALKKFPELSIVFVGEQSLALPILEENGCDLTRAEFIDTAEFITNDDPANCVFGGKDETSMVKALLRLKEDDDCFAMLSAGSTGPMLVGTICRLGLIKGLKRPALSSALPVRGGGFVCLADCGANLECPPQELALYALMGDAFMKCMCGLDAPRIGLLSVGREKGKGTPTVCQAYEHISKLPLNFIGNVEGSDLNADIADVIIADGFSGNIMLKCAEATGICAIDIADDTFTRHTDCDLVANAVHTALNDVFDFNRRGGATFLGTSKTVIKMHGCATEETVVACCGQALRLENAGFREKIAQAVVSNKI